MDRNWVGWLCLLVLVPWGCERVDDSIVAVVGQQTISIDAYDRMAETLLEGPLRELDLTASSARQELLDAMVAKELVFLEAASRGLDADSAIVAQVQELEDKLLIKTLYETRVLTDVVPTEEDLLLVFYEEDYDEEVHFSHIMCTSDGKARAAIAELEKGRPFGEVAAELSVHGPSAQRRGDMGFVPLADMLEEIRGVVLSLEIGQTHMHPVESRFGHHVFRLTGRRSVDLDAHRTAVEVRFTGRTHAKQISDYRDSLKIARQVSCREAAPPQLSSPDDTLCTWNGGALTLEAYEGAGSVADTPAPAPRRGLEEAATRALVLQEARRFGLDRDVRVTEPVGRRQRVLLAQILERDIAGDGEATEGEMRAYYDEHPEKYGPRPMVEIQEVLAADADTARQIRDRVDAGEDMSSLARAYHTREATQPRQGRMRLLQRHNTQLGDLAPQALDGEVGTVYGPLAVPGGYSVFRVEQRELRPAPSFGEARKGIAAMLRTKRKHERMARFLKELRVKYGGQIKVNAEALSRTLSDRHRDQPGS